MATMGIARERRASILMKETEELMHGLQDQANRSDALMSELEALLASSKAVPSLGAPTSACHSSSVPVTKVAPPAPVADAVDDEVEVSPTPSGHLLAVRRRSSVIILDGSSLFESGANWSTSQPFAAVDCEASSPFGRSAASFAHRGPRRLGRSVTERRLTVHSISRQPSIALGGTATPAAAALERGASSSAIPLAAAVSFRLRASASEYPDIPPGCLPADGPRALTSSGGAAVTAPVAYCYPLDHQARSEPQMPIGFSTTASSGQPLYPTESGSLSSPLPTVSTHAASSPAPEGGREPRRWAAGPPLMQKASPFTAQHGGNLAATGVRPAARPAPLRSSSFSNTFSRMSSRVAPSSPLGAPAAAWALTAASSVGAPLACNLGAGGSFTEGAQQAAASPQQAQQRPAADVIAAAALRIRRASSRSLAFLLPPR